MRCDPVAARDFWLARFLRTVLTRRPALRWGLDYSCVDRLYETCPDPVLAAQTYLLETQHALH
jgi:hypothetical protein